MMTSLPSVLAISLFAMAAFPGHAAPKPDNPLDVYRDKARILLVLAPDADDRRLLQQRAFFADAKGGADERDLALVEALGESPDAKALRRRFGLEDGSFHVVLIGKDGGDKLTSSEPLDSGRLFPVIDAMPMRRHEMNRQR